MTMKCSRAFYSDELASRVNVLTENRQQSEWYQKAANWNEEGERRKRRRRMRRKRRGEKNEQIDYSCRRRRRRRRRRRKRRGVEYKSEDRSGGEGRSEAKKEVE
jgi:hypothetical protein